MIAADTKCDFIQSDIVGAYLNVYLPANEPPVYLRVPQGMDGVPDDHVLQLHINLYGLCEAAWRWYKDLSTTLATQGWIKHHSESCVWTRLDDPMDPHSRCYFLLHVDDSLTIGRNARKHYDLLAQHYEMKDMGIPDLWCGIEFTFLPDTILLHQTAYRKHFVQHWTNHPVHPMKVTQHLSPLNANALSKIPDDAPEHNDPWYSEFCGMLNWLLLTGPEITPSAVLLFRGLGHITPQHEKAAAHLLGYLDMNPDSGIYFDRVCQPPSPPELVQFVDAEYGRNRVTGKSDEGQIIFLNGNVVSWSMKAQTMVAHSTYEAEIIALSNGTKQLSKIRNYIEGCGVELGPTLVYEDNTSVIRYARDIGLARPARSLSQHLHYGREKQQMGIIDIQPVDSADNIADFFTKPLSRINFQRNAPRLGIKSVSECKATDHVERLMNSAGKKI